MVPWDCATNLEDELDLYFSWLARFEASIPQARTTVARWYTRPALQAYTGYSWFKASTPSVPALCRVSIQVAEELRGQGCFGRLVERFLHGSGNMKLLCSTWKTSPALASSAGCFEQAFIDAHTMRANSPRLSGAIGWALSPCPPPPEVPPRVPTAR
jgi:hypothetical protein